MAKLENYGDIDRTNLVEYRESESPMVARIRSTLEQQGLDGLVDLLAGPDGAASTTPNEVRECAEILVEEYPFEASEAREKALPPLDEFQVTRCQDGGAVYEYEYGTWYFAIDEEGDGSWGWEASTPVGGWSNWYSGELRSPEDAHFDMTRWAGDIAYVEVAVD